jgi:hypothetical protein
MAEYEEISLMPLDNRGMKMTWKMPKTIHGPGVRKRPQPQPIKLKLVQQEKWSNLINFNTTGPTNML